MPTPAWDNEVPASERLRVVHVSASDIRGGAGRAAFRLHQGLLARQQSSSMLVWERASDDPTICGFVPSRRVVDRLRRRFRQRRIITDMERAGALRRVSGDQFTDDRSQFGVEVVGQLPACDLVHLHWVAGLVDYGQFLRALPRDLPVVWTLHDMNVFTGGCHYDGGCGAFTAACGACPKLNSAIEEDLSRRIWSRKREAFTELAGRPVRFVADSDWLAEEARSSSLLRDFIVDRVYYGLDTAVFQPRDRKLVRPSLGIDASATVVLFVADSLEDPRKGFGLLVEALNGLSTVPNLLLVSIGAGAPTLGEAVPHLHLGSITDDQRLAEVYSAADIFVIPSVQEAFGQTALEAIACGTPVVGFAAGGIPEIVRPGITGALAPAGDAGALRGVLERLLLDRASLARVSASCRRVAVEGHGLERQADQYLEIYRELLGMVE